MIALRLGVWMHVYALLVLVLADGFFIRAARFSNPALLLAGTVCLFLVAIIEILIVWRSLFLKKYLRAVKHLTSHGWDEAFAEIWCHSLCERRMIWIAAARTGHAEACDDLLRRLRWNLKWWTWRARARKSLARYRGGSLF